MAEDAAAAMKAAEPEPAVPVSAPATAVPAP
jgi:hypothetical protein